MSTAVPNGNELSPFAVAVRVPMLLGFLNITASGALCAVHTNAAAKNGSQHNSLVEVLSAAVDRGQALRVFFWVLTILCCGIPYLICWLTVRAQSSLLTCPLGKFAAELKPLLQQSGGKNPPVNSNPPPGPSPAGVNSPAEPDSFESLCEFFFGEGSSAKLKEAIDDRANGCDIVLEFSNSKDRCEIENSIRGIACKLNSKLSDSVNPPSNEEKWNALCKRVAQYGDSVSASTSYITTESLVQVTLRKRLGEFFDNCISKSDIDLHTHIPYELLPCPCVDYFKDHPFSYYFNELRKFAFKWPSIIKLKENVKDIEVRLLTFQNLASSFILRKNADNREYFTQLAVANYFNRPELSPLRNSGLSAFEYHAKGTFSEICDRCGLELKDRDGTRDSNWRTDEAYVACAKELVALKKDLIEKFVRRIFLGVNGDGSGKSLFNYIDQMLANTIEWDGKEQDQKDFAELKAQLKEYKTKRDAALEAFRRPLPTE